MLRTILSLAVVVLIVGVLFAQAPKTVTITGNLIDNACAESAKDLDAKAKNHPTSCAMMESCAKSGYAVYADHKLYRLDDKGNESAADVLKNTKTKNGVQVKAEGTLDGETLRVTKLTEVTATN
jgi:hypothetical protein